MKNIPVDKLSERTAQMYVEAVRDDVGDTWQGGAFVRVYHAVGGEYGPALGFAVANGPGYRPIPLWMFSPKTSSGPGSAEEKADLLNERLFGMGHDTAFAIAASTMGGKRYYTAQRSDH